MIVGWLGIDVFIFSHNISLKVYFFAFTSATFFRDDEFCITLIEIIWIAVPRKSCDNIWIIEILFFMELLYLDTMRYIKYIKGRDTMLFHITIILRKVSFNIWVFYFYIFSFKWYLSISFLMIEICTIDKTCFWKTMFESFYTGIIIDTTFKISYIS